MKIFDRPGNRYAKYLALTAAYLCFCFSLYFQYLWIINGQRRKARWIIVVTLVVFFLCSVSVLRDKSGSSFSRQWKGMCFAHVIIMLPAVVRLPSLLFREDLYPFVGVFLFYPVSLAVVIISFLREKDRLIGMIRDICRRRSTRYLAALIVIALLVTHQEKTYFFWDCHNMSFHMEIMDGAASLFNLEDLSFYSHISFPYVFFGILFMLLTGSAVTGQILYAKVLTVLAVYGFWKLMRFLFPSRSERSHFAVTLLFLVSPFITGLASYSYNDQALWLVFPILLYTLCTEQYLYAFLLGNYFVFCKEPGVITYAFLILGIYLTECVKKRKLIHDVFRWAAMILPCFLWFLTYKYVVNNEAETGVGGLTFDAGYALSKLRSYFCVDFLWLIGAMALLGFAVCVIRKKYREYAGKLFPVVLSAAAFLVFSVCVDTIVNHPRYIDALLAQLFILAAAVPMVLIRQEWVRIVLTGALSLLLFVQSFWTIDPVSRLVYQTVNVGKTEVITTSHEIMGDAWVYNRQYQNYGYIMDAALDGVCTAADSRICFPAFEDTTWHFDAMGHFFELEDDGETVITEYWDEKRATRMIEDEAAGSIPFAVHVIRSGDAVSLESGERGFFFYTDYMGSEIAEEIRGLYEVVGQEDFEKNGWIMHRMEFGYKTAG